MSVWLNPCANAINLSQASLSTSSATRIASRHCPKVVLGSAKTFGIPWDAKAETSAEGVSTVGSAPSLSMQSQSR
jgi:hypothetical protein